MLEVLIGLPTPLVVCLRAPRLTKSSSAAQAAAVTENRVAEATEMSHHCIACLQPHIQPQLAPCHKRSDASDTRTLVRLLITLNMQ